MDASNPIEEESLSSLADKVSIITELIREMAYIAWRDSRESQQSSTHDDFDRAYLGHYNVFDAYTDLIIDDHELDARLDAAVGEPFRPHVDIDVPALSRALIRSGRYYALSAEPVGVWVFKTID